MTPFDANVAGRFIGHHRQERDALNLYEGVSLLLECPQLPTCADCQAWVYDPKSSWKRMTRSGKPVPRDPRAPLPCAACPKSRDKRTPNPAAELSEKNRRCHEYYLASRAGLAVPADDVTRSNFALIQRAYDQHAETQAWFLREFVLAMGRSK